MPSIREVHDVLCAPGSLFEMETVDIGGVSTRTWKNALPNLATALREGVAASAGNDFIIFGEEHITHARHLELVESFAASLSNDLGVRKGDRVAIAMRNLPEWSIAFFGATMVGAVAVALNAFGMQDELAYTLEDCNASVVVADGERLERLAGAPSALRGRHIVGTRLDDRKGIRPLPTDVVAFDSLLSAREPATPVEVGPDDPATIFYTSGSTSRPKGVLGTHRNICSNLISLMFHTARTALRDGATTEPGPVPTVSLLAVPLFHATGSHSILLRAAFFGGTLVFMRRWDPDVALDLMEREKITTILAVPTMLWDLLNSPSVSRRDLCSIRNFGAGGSASPPELARRISECFPNAGLGTGYGLTETSATTTAIAGIDYLRRPESVGVPVPVCDVRIVGEDGRDVPVGTAGEIWIKGPNVVPGYWNNPELTAESFTRGFLHSGDIGRIDEEGFLYILDRAKDIVIRGGENISTLEIENALMEYAGVLEAAVFSLPHPTLGEQVGAVVYVATAPKVTAEELRSHVTAALAAHKVPAHIWFSDGPLPRGGTGKLLKRAVQATYASRLASQQTA